MAKQERAARKTNRNGGLNTTYLTKMGIRNVFTNGTMSLSSISVLTACLLLIGVSLILVLNISQLVKDVEKQNVVVAFLKDEVDKTQLQQIGDTLRSIENVSNVTYKSKEEAFEKQLDDFGVDEDLLDGVIENPLPDAFEITVVNMATFDETLAKIKAVEGVDVVRESQEIVNQITTLQKSILLICVVLVAVLIVVSLLIIANTVRITMASRKIDIQVMKSVGATNAFISWPFMIEGVFIGFISGVLAMGLTYVLQVTEGDALSSLFGLFGSSTFSFMDWLPYFIIGYIVLGVLLGSFGSVVSLTRYLKKEGSESELNL
ncbi:MAG: permease-like cell division protein FtsX [Clostridia bacterium]|jgi:cell division transport system permease protein|nr:permease-like cell division protein FtsX [Clostridia bacterium]